MASTFLRLFNFAKATGAAALENFTTEALATALRSDAGPMVHALEACGVGAFQTFDFVETQVSIAGVGILDLVLRAGARTVIVEIKVGAGENGGQLARYLDWLKSQHMAEQHALVLLGPRSLASDSGVTWLSWQGLSKSITATGATHPYWLDLAHFLEDIGMIDNLDGPVTSDEARSIGSSYRLMRKLVRVLAPPAALMNQVWPGSNWPEKDSDVRVQLMSRFSTGKHLSLEHRTGYKAGISMGAYDWEGDAWLGIWVWCNPRRFAERDSIQALANVSGLGPLWDREPGSWELLNAEKKLLEIPDIYSASQWLMGRITELQTVGMFSLIEQFGAAPPEVAEEGRSNEDSLQKGG
jgi:hypothetical protein